MQPVSEQAGRGAADRSDGPPDSTPAAPDRHLPLRRRPEFLRFWAAESVSQLGSQVSLLALPLVAALTLGAEPFEVGVLTAAGTAPALVVGLLAGVWVDRRRRRPILIAADLWRAVLLLAIPIAAVGGFLGMPLLYAVALASGTATVLANVAYVSYLPSLIEREHLVEGNAKLEASRSTAQVVGPGAAGWLVGTAGAPFAIALDAASFLVSAVLLWRIRRPEPPPHPASGERVWRQIGEGLRAVARQPILRPLIASTAMTDFFAFVFFAVYVLYFVRDLGLTPGAIGLVFAVGGVGALVGALLAELARRRFGQGPAIVGAQLLFGLSGMVIPLAALVPTIALEMVVVSEFLQWLTIMIVNVNALSLRQALTPDRLRGRVNATFRFVVGGTHPLGSLLGGVLGGLIGLQWTLVVGEVGMLLAVGWLLRSPLPRLRDAPPVDEGPSQGPSDAKVDE